MPTDLSIPNAIINAFMQGKQMRLQREEFETQKQQKADELKQRQQEEADRIKQQEAQLKSHQEDFDKTYALNKAVHEFTLRKMFKDVETPEEATQLGGKLEGTKFDPTGQYPTSFDISVPELGQMSIEHPEAKLYRQVQANEALEGPKRKTQQELENLKSFWDLKQKAAELQSRKEIESAHDAARIAAAKARGTSDKTTQQAIGLRAGFQSNPLINRFNIVKAQRDFAVTTSATGPDDTALISAYVKANDPNRVTEDEFTIAQRSGQSLAQQFGFQLENLTSQKPVFLSQPARDRMIATINKRYKAEEMIFKGFKKETGKAFANIGENPDNWLPDFSKDFTEDTKTKIISTQDVQKFAAENKVDLPTAKKHFEDFGYTVQ